MGPRKKLRRVSRGKRSHKLGKGVDLIEITCLNNINYRKRMLQICKIEIIHNPYIMFCSVLIRIKTYHNKNFVRSSIKVSSLEYCMFFSVITELCLAPSYILIRCRSLHFTWLAVLVGKYNATIWRQLFPCTSWAFRRINYCSWVHFVHTVLLRMYSFIRGG